MSIPILHPITRLIVGGAQENTMLTADRLNHDEAYAGRYAVEVVSGPQTGSEGSLIEEIRRRKVPLTILPELVREVNPPKDLKALWRLRRMMVDGSGKARYRIVHTHSSKAGILGRLAARSAGVPIIVHTVHGWSFHDRMPRSRRHFYILLEKLMARFTTALIAVSPLDVKKGLAHGIGRKEDYTVIRSGIEMERFGHPEVAPAVVREQLQLPADAPVVGSVTRLSPQKAPLDLVEVFAQIHQRHPEAWFIIVGDGPLREAVEQRLAQRGIREQTVLTGLRRDIPELMASFDLFLLSSLWEGLPRVLPQAMATGLPIVCTRADGSAEAVVDGVTGFLVEPGEPASLAAMANLLLDDEPLRARMGQAGRERAPIFDAVKMVEEIEGLYRRLLA